MRKTLIAVAAAAMAATGAQAGDLSGTGSSTCANLTNLWSQSAADGRQILKVLVGQWALGYFTGRNSELPLSQRRELGNLNNDGTADVIISVCSRNQNLYVYQVADAFFINLPYLRAGS
ncbi:MAG: hypothetical protein K2Q06_01340 [Parvularculaceae bacterium]|nr:hypothetical protein [Parvularculaceae bacterium]